ncbi:glycosyltransferase family 4 protein [Betaproteobacteria bacterium SCN1]|jgi:glycosyltransferase involved in cell wall biosynthesis|nr:glycosyltransferase family 4 protein [Betaproteobacteria bacterium SCN1]MBN8761342.1 glycosyltransferase family 4 protein [Thiobacillus sp.]ODU88373.1 MAG: glycosyl transferase group 1 [Thiobacillus sp. SCN 65-179]OJW36544.1 MAG: glycosyl transferase group 1 [Thiobacillus sp. 65-69]
MQKVVIIQRRLTHYRVPLFERLRVLLHARNIDLRLIAGQGTQAENLKQDAGYLPWAEPLSTRYWAGGRLCWQPLRPYLHDVDLLIVTQENKLLFNHLLVLMPRQYKLAFWGHGANLQSDSPNGLKERFKRWSTNRVDWWFAYTQMSAALIKTAGYSESNITVLNNAVDTEQLMKFRREVTLDETSALRKVLGFDAGPVGIYVGSLYADKRLDFLFDAAKSIREAVPDFHLLIVGEGAERDKVRAWCDTHAWCRWVGARFGRDKAACMSVADIMINPGGLGLGILDSFVCEVPLITISGGKHGPEIAYIENEVNGLITADGLKSYVDACVGLLHTPARLQQLRAGCAESARIYTMENMAQRFADGIVRCLGTKRGKHT